MNNHIATIEEQKTWRGVYKFVRGTPQNIAYAIQSILGMPSKNLPFIIEGLEKGENWAVNLWLLTLKAVRNEEWAQKKWMDSALHEAFSVRQYSNLIPSQLRNSFAQLIAGTTVTPTFKANYVAIGTSTTAPANTDTALGAETLRGTFNDRYAEANVAYLDKFFTTAQVAGNTYKEAGLIVDGTATADSGYLLSHVAIDEGMGANETLTMNASVTIS